MAGDPHDAYHGGFFSTVSSDEASPKTLQVLVKKPDDLLNEIKRPGLWSLCLDWTSFSDSSV